MHRIPQVSGTSPPIVDFTSGVIAGESIASLTLAGGDDSALWEWY
jgi:hypothetical protein